MPCKLPRKVVVQINSVLITEELCAGGDTDPV